ncbi:MAG TPA: PASTA domain-containing protein [Bacteroidales bacterium]|nr:PASTA domain-containing protein [Bacteroidales bacterium]
MSWTEFIKSRQFLRHLSAAVALTILLVILILSSLKAYTRHGKEFAMPDVLGMTNAELEAWSEESHMDFLVIDSVFNDELEGGTVYTQYPYPGAMIKKGRQVYVTMVAMSREKVSMPDLRDFTLRQAMAMLETYRLSVDSIMYVPDIGRTVIEVRQGREVIEAGELIPKGTAVILVMGSGSGGNRLHMPFLLGKSRAEALRLLEASFLMSGAEFFPEDGDTSDLVVFRQHPPYRTSGGVSMGRPVDLWYVNRRDFVMEEAMRQLGQDTLAADSLAPGGRSNIDSSLLEF